MNTGGDGNVRYVCGDMKRSADILSNLLDLQMNEFCSCTAKDCNIVCGVISPGPTRRIMSYDLKPGNIIISLPDNKARVHFYTAGHQLTVQKQDEVF